MPLTELHHVNSSNCLSVLNHTYAFWMHLTHFLCFKHILPVLPHNFFFWQLNIGCRISISSQTGLKIPIKDTEDSSKLFANVSLQQKLSQRWLFSDQPLSITSSDIPWGNAGSAKRTINSTCPLSSELKTHPVIPKPGFFIYICFKTHRKWANDICVIHHHLKKVHVVQLCQSLVTCFSVSELNNRQQCTVDVCLCNSFFSEFLVFFFLWPFYSSNSTLIVAKNSNRRKKSK